MPPASRVVQRLDSDTVSREHQASARAVPDARSRTCLAAARRTRGRPPRRGGRAPRCPSRVRKLVARALAAPLRARDSCRSRRSGSPGRCRPRWRSAGRPPARSMIESRRIASPTGPSRKVPSLSGPRCVSASFIASSASRSAALPSSSRIPHIPHTPETLAGPGTEMNFATRSLSDSIVAAPANSRARAARRARSSGSAGEGAHGRDERRRVARRHQQAGAAIIERVPHPADVRGDDRQSRRPSLRGRPGLPRSESRGTNASASR